MQRSPGCAGWPNACWLTKPMLDEPKIQVESQLRKIQIQYIQVVHQIVDNVFNHLLVITENAQVLSQNN